MNPNSKQQMILLSKEKYYCTVERTPEQPSASNSQGIWAVAATLGFGLVCFGTALLLSGVPATTYLSSRTVDVQVQQGWHGVETGVEVAEDGSAKYTAALTTQTDFGNVKAGIVARRKGVSKEGEKTTQTVDFTHKEGNTAFKLGLKKAGEAAWKWKAGTETVGVIAATPVEQEDENAPVETAPKPKRIWNKSGPLIAQATVGVSEGDLKYDAGVKSVGGKLRWVGGISGGSKTNSWGLRAETPMGDKDGSWKVKVSAGN